MYASLTSTLYHNMSHFYSEPIQCHMEVGDCVVCLKAGKDTHVMDRVWCNSIQNLEIHLEVASVFVASQLHPNLITWYKSFLPEDCSFTEQCLIYIS